MNEKNRKCSTRLVRVEFSGVKIEVSQIIGTEHPESKKEVLHVSKSGG